MMSSCYSSNSSYMRSIRRHCLCVRHCAAVTCADADVQVQHLPWFGAMQGYALVKPPGSFSHEDDPTAVIALTEGGHLCVHDVHSHSQEPFHLEFQVRWPTV
jgi:hypothetical protein